jgi:hypothetical protein
MVLMLDSCAACATDCGLLPPIPAGRCAGLEELGGGVAVVAELPARTGRRARRANSSDGPREIVQKVKLTATEQAALKLRARAQGVSVPRLMVESALSDGETSTDRRDLLAQLFGLHRLSANIANNVNQLAAKANSENTFPTAAGPVLAHIERLLQRIDDTIDQVGGAR